MELRIHTFIIIKSLTHQFNTSLCHRQGRSAAKDMTLMCGGEYDQPLEEFNEVFTNPDELLGVLESGLESFEAKKVLCKIFQVRNTFMSQF